MKICAVPERLMAELPLVDLTVVRVRVSAPRL